MLSRAVNSVSGFVELHLEGHGYLRQIKTKIVRSRGDVVITKKLLSRFSNKLAEGAFISGFYNEFELNGKLVKNLVYINEIEGQHISLIKLGNLVPVENCNLSEKFLSNFEVIDIADFIPDVNGQEEETPEALNETYFNICRWSNICYSRTKFLARLGRKILYEVPVEFYEQINARPPQLGIFKCPENGGMAVITRMGKPSETTTSEKQ